jgi:uncharacterized damage-inducible protein DinB
MSAGLVQTYRAFAHNNAWANHRLLTSCASLSQEQFEAERTSFFPSLQLTLNHIYVIDLFYVDALEGGWLGPAAWKNDVPCPTVAELAIAQAAVDGRLIAVCDALTPELLDGFVRVNRDSRVQTERRDRLLMHTSFNIKSIIADRHTRCCQARLSNRPNSTSFLQQKKRHSGPASSQDSGGVKTRSGAAARSGCSPNGTSVSPQTYLDLIILPRISPRG